jgi:hypothetical protein
MMRRQGPLVPAEAHACTRFEARPVPRPKPPRTSREKFLAEDAWRFSQRTPGNVLRSVLGTSLTVVIFARFGLWGWMISDDDVMSPIFSEDLFETKEDAQADVWECEIEAIVGPGDDHG